MRRGLLSGALLLAAALLAWPQSKRSPLERAVMRMDVNACRAFLEGRKTPRPSPSEASDALLWLSHPNPSVYNPGYTVQPRATAIIAMARLLLDHGADPNPSVWEAAQAWNPEILEVLLSRGGKAEQRLDVQYEHRSPLFDAVCSDRAAACFRANDPLPNKLGAESYQKVGATPPKASRDRLLRLDRTAEVLLRHGADANLPGTWGAIPFHRSCYWGRGPQVRAMLRYGAKVNLRRTPNNVPAHKGTTLPDYTPLHCAALRDSHRNAEVVFILLKAGADWRLKDELGRTPYALAKQKGNLKIARAFESAGVRR